jgi:hypothetical protein
MINSMMGEEAAVQTIINGLAAFQESRTVSKNGLSKEQ